MREINHAGIGLIRDFTECRLDAWSPDGGKTFKAGWGAAGDDVKAGARMSQEEADRVFLAEVNDTAGHVAKLVTADINDNQFAALVSFAMDMGVGGGKKSSGLAASDVLKQTNAGKPAKAAAAFADAGGDERRRDAERVLYETPA
jgi:lysozyme